MPALFSSERNTIVFKHFFGRLIKPVLLLLLMTGPASASYMANNVSKAMHASFITDSERSRDPYYQFTQGTAAYEAEDYESAAKIFTELAKIGYIHALS